MCDVAFYEERLQLSRELDSGDRGHLKGGTRVGEVDEPRDWSN